MNDADYKKWWCELMMASIPVNEQAVALFGAALQCAALDAATANEREAKRVPALLDELERLRAGLQQAAALLDECEFAGWNGEGYDPCGDVCPVCYGGDETFPRQRKHALGCRLESWLLSHAPDCELWKALKKSTTTT